MFTYNENSEEKKNTKPVKKNLLGRKAFAVAAGVNHFFALCED
jgi:hypothetical protein